MDYENIYKSGMLVADIKALILCCSFQIKDLHDETFSACATNNKV